METKKKHFIIESDRLFLLPYLPSVVPIYHQWMQNEEILFLTGSEPLTLEEELDNQKSWMEDNSKYTFIIFSKGSCAQECFQQNEKIFSNEKEFIFPKIFPIGDINAFFHTYLEKSECEIDIMIADKNFQRKGFAKESILIFQKFLFENFRIQRFIAKIKKNNLASIQLFTQLGYKEFFICNSFDEIHFDYNFENKNDSEIFPKFNSTLISNIL